MLQATHIRLEKRKADVAMSLRRISESDRSQSSAMRTTESAGQPLHFVIFMRSHLFPITQMTARLDYSSSTSIPFVLAPSSTELADPRVPLVRELFRPLR